MSIFKSIILLCLLIVGNLKNISGQILFPTGPQKHFIWVHTMDKHRTNARYLSEYQDSSITIMDRKKNNKQIINIENITYLEFRRKGDELRGFFLGAFGGCLTGVFLGLARGDDDTADFFSLSAEQNAVLFGILLTPPGAILGSILGSRKIKVPINGDINNYNRQKKIIESYKYKF